MAAHFAQLLSYVRVFTSRVLRLLPTQWRHQGVCPPPGGNVFVVAPNPAVRSPMDILMVTTMALVWTVNSTLSWGVIT